MSNLALTVLVGYVIFGLLSSFEEYRERQRGIDDGHERIVSWRTILAMPIIWGISLVINLIIMMIYDAGFEDLANSLNEILFHTSTVSNEYLEEEDERYFLPDKS